MTSEKLRRKQYEKRVAAYLNPRVVRIAALPAPTERQRTQWYFQASGSV